MEEKLTVVIRPGSMSVVGDMCIGITRECCDRKSVADERANRDRLIVVGLVKYIRREVRRLKQQGQTKKAGPRLAWVRRFDAGQGSAVFATIVDTEKL